jgi:hypothetical protein
MMRAVDGYVSECGCPVATAEAGGEVPYLILKRMEAGKGRSKKGYAVDHDTGN